MTEEERLLSLDPKDPEWYSDEAKNARASKEWNDKLENTIKTQQKELQQMFRLASQMTETIDEFGSEDTEYYENECQKVSDENADLELIKLNWFGDNEND